MGRKQNLIFVVSCMGKGGTQRVISNLANYLCEKYQITIIQLFSSEINYYLDKRIEVIDYSNSNKNKIFQVISLITKLRLFFKKNKNLEITIFSFLTKVNLISILSNLGLGNRVVISERNDPRNDKRSLIVRIFTNLLYPLSYKVVFQTEYAKSSFNKHIQKKGTIIKNPIIVPDDLSVNNQSYNIISVGRLIEQKNHCLIIEAFAKISKNKPNLKLTIYGEGDQRQKLETRIKELNLEKKVFLPGIVDNIFYELTNSMFFVLASEYEGQSNALLEAMAVGLPCIVTNCSGVDEIVNSENGVLIEKGNLTELISAMEYLSNNPQERIKLGNKAKETMKNLTLNKISKEWIAILDDERVD